jgi:hypothetical protein
LYEHVFVHVLRHDILMIVANTTEAKIKVNLEQNYTEREVTHL